MEKASQREELLLKDIVRFNTIFCLDLRTIGKVLMKDPSNQTWCRVFIRTCVSYTETICCKLAEGLYPIFMKSYGIPPEVFGFKADKAGSLHWRDDKIEKRIIKVVSLWTAFAGGTSLDLQKFEANLRDSIRIRHRITHPKSAAELVVSPDELKKVTESTKEFRDFIDLTKKELIARRDKLLLKKPKKVMKSSC